MSQKQQPRRLAGIEAMAKVRTLRTSARKLNLVAQSIRGLKVQRALNELEFSHKRLGRSQDHRCGGRGDVAAANAAAGLRVISDAEQ